MSDKPLVRPAEFKPVVYQGQQMWLLRDPLELSDYQLILTPALAQIVTFCDGTRNREEIREAASRFFEVEVNGEIVDEVLAQLDEACLLDNRRARSASQTALAHYRAQEHREPALAGHGYPEDIEELGRAFAAYGADDELNGWRPWRGRGIISPHIDYQRGGPVYSMVWRRAEAAVKEAELVLIFGTDHNGGEGSITLTRKAYATPHGILPTDLDLVDGLTRAIGPQVFDHELHHRKEHSVELSAVWFHQIRGDNSCPMVPILCGSFHEFLTDGGCPENDARLTALIETLQNKTAGRRVLAVASVDLAHVGPAFGDDFAMDASRRAKLIEKDNLLMNAIGEGDAERFYQEIASIKDRNRICGFSSIYLMLRYLGATQGMQIAYDHCPADQENQSLVSICGMLLD